MNLDCFERRLAPTTRMGAGRQGNQRFRDRHFTFRQAQEAAKEGECFATCNARPFRGSTSTAQAAQAGMETA
jgi:hypothetical protein